MGVKAHYMMVSDSELAQFITLDEASMVGEIEALRTDHCVLDIENMWDGLHFMLTGRSASSPIEDDPLSDAIVGMNVLSEDNFIACIYNDQLDYIIEVLEQIDFAQLRISFNPKELNDAEIYPDIWFDADRQALFDRLLQAFNEMQAFYIQAQNKNMDILVSIY